MVVEDTKLDPAHVAWCRNVWDLLAEGGSWDIPRSGLIFCKRQGALRLIMRMEYMPEMEGTITPGQLTLQQNRDLALTRRHFAEIGVEVPDDTTEEL